LAGRTRAGRLRRARLLVIHEDTRRHTKEEQKPVFLEKTGFWRSVFLAIIVCIAVAGCVPRVTIGRDVTVHVADGSTDLAGLTRVVVTLRDAGLHRANQPRDEGWVELELTTPGFELGAAGTTGVLVARGRVPAGPYDRVRVEVAEVYGEQGGQRVAVRNIVEPIYLPAPLLGGPADLCLEFIVLPLDTPNSPEKWAIYTKGIEVR
jgi:hypothetical protein